MNKTMDAIMEVVGLLRASGKPLEDEEIVAKESSKGVFRTRYSP